MVVLDFGISAAVSPDRQVVGTKLTAKGTSIGTPQYMSPEQAAGEEVTDRSDVYSLGLVAFELLTGRPPFEEKNAMALVAAHIHKTPPATLTVRPEISPDVALLIDDCLKKGEGDRPKTDALTRALLPERLPTVEWPPPGLDALHHTGTRFSTGLLLAVGIGVFFFLLLHVAPTYNSARWRDGEVSGFWFTVAGGPRTQQFGGSIPKRDPTPIWLFLMGASALAAFGFGTFALVRGIGLGSTLIRARRSSYPTGVCLDVAFDGHADTAKLINGTGVYATLNAAQRERLRRYRRWRATLPIAMPVLSVLATFTWLVAWTSAGTGADTIVSVPALLFILLPIAVGLFLYAALVTIERRRTARTGLSLKRRLVRLRQPLVNRELAAVWLGNASVPAHATGRPGRIVLLGLLPQVITVLALGVFVSTMGLILGVSLRTSQYVAAHRQAATNWEEARRSDTAATWSQFEAALSGSILMGRRKEVADSTAPFEMLALLTSHEPMDQPPSNTDSALNLGGRVWNVPDTSFDVAFPIYRGFRESTLRIFSSLPQRDSIVIAEDFRSLLVQDTAFAAYDIWKRFARSEPPPPLWMYREEFGGLLGPFHLPPLSDDGLLGLMEASRAAALLSLERGDTISAINAVSDIVVIGRTLAREPVPDINDLGLFALESGLSNMEQLAAFVGYEALRQEADSLWRLIPRAHSQFVEFGSSHPWYGSKWGGPMPPEPLLLTASAGTSSELTLLADSTLSTGDRWALMFAVVPAFCVSPREVLLGIDPQRKNALEAALPLAQGIPRTDEWIQLNVRWFEEWQRSPSAAIRRWDGWRPNVPLPLKLLAWVGLGGLRDRITFCEALVWH